MSGANEAVYEGLVSSFVGGGGMEYLLSCRLALDDQMSKQQVSSCKKQKFK